jgi:hypothetical protein
VVNLGFIDTLGNQNLYQMIRRLKREFRYGLLYPWMGSVLFPVSKGAHGALSAFAVLQTFHEGAASINGSQENLLQEAEDLCHQRFKLLNLPSICLGAPIYWRYGSKSDRLWEYTLHYGEWAVVLARAFMITHEDRFRDVLIRLLIDWIEQNAVGRGSGWEPYPISRRLVFWTRVANALKEDLKWKKFWQAT